MTMAERVEILAQHNPAWGQIDCYVFTEGRTYIAQPETLSVEPVEKGKGYKPLFTLTHDTARALMDALQRAGVRPTEDKGNAAFDAQGAHLADLRGALKQAQAYNDRLLEFVLAE